MVRNAATRSAALTVAVVLGAAGLGGCSRSSGSTEAFCTQVKQVPSLEAGLSRFSETDPDVLADRIDKARSSYHDLADAAPDDIADETDDVVALVDDILDAVADNPDDPAGAADQLRAAMAKHKGVDTARGKVAAFAKKECKVTLDPALSATTAPPPTSTTVPDTTTTGG